MTDCQRTDEFDQHVKDVPQQQGLARGPLMGAMLRLVDLALRAMKRLGFNR